MLQRPVFTAPTLTNEELLAVYQTAKSTDLDILRQTAVELFPERFQDETAPKEQVLVDGQGERYRMARLY